MERPDPARPGEPGVHLLCGLPGAGKTTYARRLAAELPAVRFTLDEWMLRLYGFRYDDPRYAARLDGCTALIWDTARQVLGLGCDVVLDWNQWSRERRSEWRRRAMGERCRTVLHHVDVPVEVAVERVAHRGGGDASAHQLDADAVRRLAAIFQPPTDDEGLDIVTPSP